MRGFVLQSSIATWLFTFLANIHESITLGPGDEAWFTLKGRKTLA